MSPVWFVEIVFSHAPGWEDRVDDLMAALEPVSGTLGSHPDADLSVRVAVEAGDAIKSVQVACMPVMEALRSVGLESAVIRSTEVLSEVEMDALLTGQSAPHLLARGGDAAMERP